MSKTLLVLRNEFISTVSRKSFLFTAIGIPLIGFLIFTGVGLLGQGGTSGVESIISGAVATAKLDGYVDQSGLIRTIPADLPPGLLAPFPDEASARRALDAGEIKAYYLIPSDYLTSGTVYYIDPNARPFLSGVQTWIMRWTLFVNLLGGDAELAARVRNPMEIFVTALSPSPEREIAMDQGMSAAFWIPYAVTMIFYFVIMTSASLLLNSISKEKTNRVMEMLMASVSPRQMLAGKIAGLGIAGLIQTIAWVGTGYALLRLGGTTLSIPASLQLSPSILVWGVVFFLLGYAVYASLMAALGALVPNIREASQATISVIWPLIIPLFFINALIQDPNSTLSLALGMIPFTAPIAMMTRLAAGGIPWWQPVLAAVLLLGTAIFIVRAVSGMFRAQTLLSGQAFSAKRFWGSLLGR
jgi:ABC-2 type transport system permease protein